MISGYLLFAALKYSKYTHCAVVPAADLWEEPKLLSYSQKSPGGLKFVTLRNIIEMLIF